MNDNIPLLLLCARSWGLQEQSDLWPSMIRRGFANCNENKRETTRMYVQRNTQARSCNHCCGGKAVSITYSECVCL